MDSMTFNLPREIQEAVSACIRERDQLRAERDTALANWDLQKLETDSLRAENEELLKMLKEWRDYADHGCVPSDECLDKTDAALCGKEWIE